MRRMKAASLRAAAGRGVRRIVSATGNKSPYDGIGAPDFAQTWAGGDASARLEFTKILKRADLTTNEVMAEALADGINFFERLDRMLASSEARRNNALREIDRHRAALARGASIGR